MTPFLENDAVLGDVDEHFSGNYLNEATILKLARDKGYSTASIGKIGPVLYLRTRPNGTGSQTIIVDDATGTPRGIPLSAEVTDRLKASELPLATPGRRRQRQGWKPDDSRHAQCQYGRAQQDYFAAVTTRAVLPIFKDRNKPFILVFWSRDPDGSQHNQGDSLNTLIPASTGPTSLAAILATPTTTFARIQFDAQRTRTARYDRRDRDRRPRFLDHLQGKPDQLSTVA